MSRIHAFASRSRRRASTGRGGEGAGTFSITLAKDRCPYGTHRAEGALLRPDERGRLLAQPDGLSQRLVELRQIARNARGNEIAVDDQRLVDVVRAGVHDIVADLLHAGDGAPVEHFGGDEQLRTVADRADRLARFDEAPREGDRLIDDAQILRGAATGDDQHVELVRGHLVEGALDLEHAALLPLDRPSCLANGDNLRAERFEVILGVDRLGIFEIVRQNHRYFLGHQSLLHRLPRSTSVAKNRPSTRQYTGRPTPICASPQYLEDHMQGARRVDASIPVGFRDDDARAVLAAIDPDETIA